MKQIASLEENFGQAFYNEMDEGFLKRWQEFKSIQYDEEIRSAVANELRP